MKIRLSKIFSLFMGITLAGCAGACSLSPSTSSTNSSESVHEHVFGEWTLTEAAANCVGAAFGRTCEICEYVETRVGTDEDHVWEITYDITHHNISCVNCEQGEEAKHTNNGDGLCKACDRLIPTACVTYRISDDGSYATVTGYDKTETNVVVISPYYNDVPVTEIADSAFEGCADLANVYIHDGITRIGENAFSGCERLMGIYLFESVTHIGENAFNGCNELTIFCEAESKPDGWNENWNPSKQKTFWAHKNQIATPVSMKASIIMDGILQVVDDRSQIRISPNTEEVVAPEGFSTLTRYDSERENTVNPWIKSVLWHYHFNATNLKEYSDVWFAVKLENAYWAFVGELEKNIVSPWLYFHIKQSHTDVLGYVYWDIEVSIGGQVYVVNNNQTGAHLDGDRPVNSLARLLWDEGFSSTDGNAILIYDLGEGAPVHIYCTEVLGVKKV